MRCIPLKIIVQVVLFFVSTVSFAQLGIGTSSPNTSSQLEVVSNNKGVLIPQIALTSETDTHTITNGNVESLLVYNTTNAGGLTLGYYYWSNAKWHRLAIATDVSSLSVVDHLSSTSATDVLSANQGSVLKALVDVNTAKTGITTAQANAIVANTAKETNATHTGDVTGRVALTIADDAVTTTKILDNAVTTSKIADDAVTTSKIGTAGATDGNKMLTTDASGNPQWENKFTAVTPYLGDTKNSFQAADHAGWIKLDGRAITNLTSTQQTQAIALGIGANLPNDIQEGKVDGSNIYQTRNQSNKGEIVFSSTVLQNIPNDYVTKSSNSKEFTLKKGKYIVEWEVGYNTTDYVTLDLYLNGSGYLSEVNYNRASAGGLGNWSGATSRQTVIDATSSNQIIKFSGDVWVGTMKITKLKDDSESKFIYLGN